MATEALADRLTIHAGCCARAADESTDAVIDIHQMKALAEDLTEAATELRALAGAEVGGWISVRDRLPEDGVGVLVFTPGDDGGIYFDACDDGCWIEHSEHYDHYLSVGSGSMDCPIIGPSQEAPYTHWHAIPTPPPGSGRGGVEHE